MIPRLTQAYPAIEYRGWLSMPRRWLLAYLEMMPRLQAEQSMRLIEATLYPHYQGKRGDAARRRIWNELERRAAGGKLHRLGGVVRSGRELRQWLARAGGIDATERDDGRPRSPYGRVEPAHSYAPPPVTAPPDFDLALFDALPNDGEDGE
jgi:hypothetical protein